MPYKHNHVKSRGYRVPAGRHIPAMLEQYRQQSLKNRVGHHSKRQRDALSLQFVLSAAQTMNAVDISRLTGNKRSWYVIFLLLMIFPLLVQSQGLPDLNKNSIKLDVDRLPWLPSDAACTLKSEGISPGMICDLEGTTYFMKELAEFVIDNDMGKPNSPAAILVYEEFNRHFLSSNVGIRVPSSTFFKAKENENKIKCYIATEKIDDLKFVDTRISQDKKLGFQGVARHAVATMFIDDLHGKNFGYDTNGLIIIDVDSRNRIPHSIELYMSRAITGLEKYSMLLSIYHVRQMIRIFEKMRDIPLPAYHDEFDLSHTNYLRLLDTYIVLCKQTIDYFKTNHKELKADAPDWRINDFLLRRIESEKLLMEKERSSRSLKDKKGI